MMNLFEASLSPQGHVLDDTAKLDEPNENYKTRRKDKKVDQKKTEKSNFRGQLSERSMLDFSDLPSDQ